MYSGHVELQANIHQTDIFIRSHPSRRDIIISREEHVADSAGGWDTTSSSLASQEVAMVAATTQTPIRRTADGQEITPEFILIGRHDADIRSGDWFWIDGHKYEVVFVHPDKSYEVRAEVMYRG